MRNLTTYFPALLFFGIFSHTVMAEHMEEQLAQGVAAFKDENYSQAMTLWQLLAETGNHDAQYNLGLMFHNGWGVERDLKQAHEWYTHAANQGNTDAMYNLGVMYLNGEGVFQSARQALDLFTYAATAGHTPSMHNLGVMYAYGMGCKQDANKAIALWEQAANQGNTIARAALVQAFEQGLTGLPADPTKAAQWRAPSAQSQ